MMEDQPDPSIEATRTVSQDLSVSSHLEGKPDWAFNCRWEDWAASGIPKESMEERRKNLDTGKDPSLSSREPSLNDRVGSSHAKVSTMLESSSEIKQISIEPKHRSQNL